MNNHKMEFGHLSLEICLKNMVKLIFHLPYWMHLYIVDIL